MNMIKKKADKRVAIVMGSKSDYPIMKFCEKTLKNLSLRLIDTLKKHLSNEAHRVFVLH